MKLAFLGIESPLLSAGRGAGAVFTPQECGLGELFRRKQANYANVRSFERVHTRFDLCWL